MNTFAALLPLLTETPIAIAIAPLAGAYALRRFWSRKRVEAEVSRREQLAQQAQAEAVRATHEALVAAEIAQKSRAEFLARMSHELRTPLNAVIGFSRVLENNKAGNQRPEDLQLLGRVRAGGEQLLKLVEDVLDQSEIERGQLSLSLDDTDVRAIVERVVQGFQSTASRKGIRLEANLPRAATSIQLDARRLEQVVHHLVDNALKFTREGSVKVTLATTAATQRPSRLIVADTGIGIAPEQLGRIFEPFEQGLNSADRSYGGAGLGLPVASQLCEAMSCRLSVESQQGTGSRFTLRFPGS